MIRFLDKAGNAYCYRNSELVPCSGVHRTAIDLHEYGEFPTHISVNGKRIKIVRSEEMSVPGKYK